MYSTVPPGAVTQLTAHTPPSGIQSRSLPVKPLLNSSAVHVAVVELPEDFASAMSGGHAAMNRKATHKDDKFHRLENSTLTGRKTRVLVGVLAKVVKLAKFRSHMKHYSRSEHFSEDRISRGQHKWFSSSSNGFNYHLRGAVQIEKLSLAPAFRILSRERVTFKLSSHELADLSKKPQRCLYRKTPVSSHTRCIWALKRMHSGAGTKHWDCEM